MVPLFKPSTFRLNGLNHDDVGGNRPPTYPTLVVARKAFQWTSHSKRGRRTCALEKISVPRSCASCLLYLAAVREKNYFVDPLLLLLYRKVDCLADWRRLVAKTCSSEPTKSGSNGWRKTFLFQKMTRMNQSTVKGVGEKKSTCVDLYLDDYCVKLIFLSFFISLFIIAFAIPLVRENVARSTVLPHDNLKDNRWFDEKTNKMKLGVS